MIPLNSQLIISEGTYNDNEASSVRNIANARLSKPDTINSFITYAYGSGGQYGNKNFPLLYATVGQGKKRAIKSLDNTYQSYMYGKPKKTDMVARNIPNQVKAGANGSKFVLAFKNKFFMRNQIINAGGVNKSVQAQVYGEPLRDGNVFLYTLMLVGTPNASGCPAEFLKAGAVWGSGVVKVSLERSRGTDHRQPQTPFKVKNQLSLIRKSYNFYGNVANKKIDIKLKVDGNEFEYWVDWEMYNNEMLFMQEKNEDLIFSEYNADKNGVIHNVDSDTGEVVPSGMGAWQQIPNTLYYTHMTEHKASSFIDIMLYNNNISGNNEKGEYVITGGQGLLQEFDKAMKRSSSGFLTLSDKFVRGKDNMNLQYGAYFTEYLHSSGKVIKFVHDKAFDFGAKAAASPRHPIYTNMSMMSFCGMALDFSMVEVGKGEESNVMFVYEEGREYLDWLVLGGAKVPTTDMANYKSRASDIDASAQHMMCSQGIHINYPSSCGKIICNLS